MSKKKKGKKINTRQTQEASSCNDNDNKNMSQEHCTTLMVIDRPEIEKTENRKHRRIVDLLDLQLLVAVIVFFVSGWAYLNGIICDFSGSEPYNERMGYILVHYILTVVLALCVYITFIKSKYLFSDEDVQLKDYERKWVDFFVYSWIFVLIVCIGIILATQNTQDVVNEKLEDYVWIICAGVFLGIVYGLMSKNGFKPDVKWIIIVALIVFFPFFIAMMMSISKDVEIKVEQPKESYGQRVFITVNAKGYDCKYILEGLADTRLKKGIDYEVKGDAIIEADPICFPNNKVEVSLVSPSVNDFNYIYALRKILLNAPQPIEGIKLEERKKYYKSVIINLQ